MLKKIILCFGMLLMISLANAIYEGQNITQAQLNNFNLNDINMTFLNFTAIGNVRADQNAIFFEMSHYDINKINNYYNIVKVRQWFSIDIPLALDCYLHPENCEDNMQPTLAQIDYRIRDIRMKVLQYQNPSFVEMIENWIRNFFR